MASNNYAEFIADAARARNVLVRLEDLAEGGRKFKMLEFNPDTDRYAIYGGRESRASANFRIADHTPGT